MSHKKTWLFLRGLGRSSSHWGDFKKLFQEKFPEDELCFMDTAGNGQEVDKNSFLNIADYVEDLRQRNHFRIKEAPLNIVSISMGSMMALDWAHRYPQETNSVVIINTSDKSRSHFYERLQPKNWLSLIESLTTQDAEQREHAILAMTAGDLIDSPKWIAEFAKLTPTKKSNLLRQIIAASRYQLPPQKPDVPILVLSAQQDQFVDPVCSQRIALAWKLPHEIHPQAGHDLPLCDPKWVIQRIADFSSRS